MHLQTLGGLALMGTGLTRPKPLLLLAYLALEGPQSRRHLAELFWPEAAQPMNSLRVALSQVRASAPDALAEEGPRLSARLEADAPRLLSLLDANALEEAVAAYRGSFLDGVHLPSLGAELEEWLYATREYLARRVRGALLALAEADAAGSGFREAAQRSELALALPGAPPLEPSELARFHRLLLAGGSPRAEALRREGAELGLALGSERGAAQAQFTRSAERDAPNNLPHPTSSFVGRDPELLELSRLIADPAARLITLTGAGGVGKTRLALQAARQELRGTHQDGVYFAALESVSGAQHLAPALAQTLDLKLPGRRDPASELAQALGERAVLLVMDNCEHLPESGPLAKRLLEGCPRLTVLATSREPLGVPGEQLFALFGLPVPAGHAPPEQARALEAVQLFWQRARRARLDFAPEGDELEAVLELCRRLDGSPLALELAAAWMRLLTPAEVVAELNESPDLSALEGTAPDRHRSLRATFEHSWQLLSPREQGVLRKLSVFAGGFTRRAAAEVSGASIATLASLLGKSLLRPQGAGRYDRHPLAYSFTRERLAVHPEEEAEAHAAHAGFFLRLAEEAEAQHRGAQQALWLARLESERDNLRAALGWALAGGDPETGLKLAVALYHFWYYRSHLLEGEAWLEQALSVSQTDPARVALTSRLLSAAGVIASERGDDARAQARFEARLALARSLQDRAGEAAALNSLGIVAWNQQDFARAQRLIEASLALRRELGQPKLLLLALNNLGLVALAQGDLASAREFLLESLSLSRELNDEMGVAMSLSNLGAVAVDARDPAEAEARLTEALPHYRALGDQDGLAHCLEGFAAIAALRGRPRLAAQFAGAAEGLRASVAAALSPSDCARHERRLAPARAALSEADFAAAWTQGRAWTPDEAATQALRSPLAPQTQATPQAQRGSK